MANVYLYYEVMDAHDVSIGTGFERPEKPRRVIFYELFKITTPQSPRQLLEELMKSIACRTKLHPHEYDGLRGKPEDKDKKYKNHIRNMDYYVKRSIGDDMPNSSIYPVCMEFIRANRGRKLK